MVLGEVEQHGPVDGVEADEGDGEGYPGHPLNITGSHTTQCCWSWLNWSNYWQQIYCGECLVVMNLPLQFSRHLLNLLLELCEPLLVQLDSLASVADSGILQQSTKHHPEAESQVDIQSFHVGYFRKRSEMLNIDVTDNAF